MIKKCPFSEDFILQMEEKTEALDPGHVAQCPDCRSLEKFYQQMDPPLLEMKREKLPVDIRNKLNQLTGTKIILITEKKKLRFWHLLSMIEAGITLILIALFGLLVGKIYLQPQPDALNTEKSAVPLPAQTSPRTSPVPQISLSAENSLLDIPIPEQWGTETLKHRGTNGKTIGLIQDLHGNTLAQRNLGKILARLGDAGTTVIASEGAAGPVDIRPVRTIASSSARRMISEYFLRGGFFSGIEYLVSTDLTHPWSLFGLEDPALYVRNLKQYQTLIRRGPKTRRLLLKLDQAMSERARQEIHPALLEKRNQIFRQWDQETLYESLLAWAGELNIEPGPQMTLWNKQKMLEKNGLVSIERVSRERLSLIKELSSSLSKEEGRTLLNHALAYRRGMETTGEFYGLLSRFIQEKKFPMKAYPTLERYMKLTALESQKNDEQLFEEKSALARKIEDTLAATENERQFIREDWTFHTWQGFLRDELTRREIEEFRSTRKNLYTPALRTFLEQDGTQILKDRQWKWIEKTEKKVQSFYDTVLARDKILFQRALKTMEDQGTSGLLMICGGFHTQGVTEALRDKGFSYRVILPMGDPGQSDQNYLDQISGKLNPMKELFNLHPVHLAAAIHFWNELHKEPVISEKVQVFSNTLFALTLALDDTLRRLEPAIELNHQVEQIRSRMQAQGLPATSEVKIENGEIFVHDGTAEGIWKPVDQLLGDVESYLDLPKAYQAALQQKWRNLTPQQRIDRIIESISCLPNAWEHLPNQNFSTPEEAMTAFAQNPASFETAFRVAALENIRGGKNVTAQEAAASLLEEIHPDESVQKLIADIVADFVRDPEPVRQMTKTLHNNSLETVRRNLSGLNQTLNTQDPLVIWIDYSTFNQNELGEIKHKLSRDNVILIVVNHETLLEETFQKDLMIEELKKKMGDRIITQNIPGIREGPAFRIEAEKLLDQAAKRLGLSRERILNDALWLIWDHLHKGLYRDFPGFEIAVSIVLSDPEAHIVTDDDLKDVSPELKETLRTGIQLLEEREVSLENTRNRYKIRQRTLRAK